MITLLWIASKEINLLNNHISIFTNFQVWYLLQLCRCTAMIRFSVRGAYLLLVPQGRALIRDRALSYFLRNNGLFKTDLLNLGSLLARTISWAIATNFDVEIIPLKELCTHMDIIVEKFGRRPLFVMRHGRWTSVDTNSDGAVSNTIILEQGRLLEWRRLLEWERLVIKTHSKGGAY